MADIFKSKFTLEFKSSIIQGDYQKMRNKNMRQYNIIYSVINFIISISHCLIYALTFLAQKDIFYLYVKYIAYCLTFLQGVNLMLSIFVKNTNFQKWISYMNICVFFVISMTLRIYIGNFAKLDYLILNMIYLTQQTYLMAWFFSHSLDFYDGFWVYLSISIISFGIFAPVHPLALNFRFLIATYIIMLGSLVSYFYIEEKKKSFYFNFINESTIKSYRSIIQNMNSGFISVKNSRIESWNKNIYSHLNNINKQIEDNNSNNIMNEDAIINNNNSIDYSSLENEKTKRLLNELFNGVVVDSESQPVAELTDFQKVYEFVKNYQNNDSIEKENFIFVGKKTFQYNILDYPTQYYEIFGRYCDRFKQEQENKYEFIFNDISKIKLSEEINADLKYKKIFLSKVAHEFKNPLLCVSELIDQLKEELCDFGINIYNNPMSKKKVNNNISQIKSMCEYLLILVKDLDFFSQSTGSTNKIILEKQKIKLDHVISYCHNITHVLLKKFQKEDYVKFKIDCPEELSQREIFTDEVRLKQLLINLLSNSVKYTYNGSIALQIEEDNENIIFNIKDTGEGLSEEQKKRLISNRYDNSVIGGFSSGLGFSIIKEIINLFQSHLNYESLDPGSKFSFKLDKVVNFSESINGSLGNSCHNSSSSVASEPITVRKSFSPLRNHDEMINISDQIKFDLLESKEEGIDLIRAEAETDYYLVVDDESFTRKSTIRIMNTFLNSKIKNSRKNIILEASDGIECLNVFYKCIQKGIKLSFIISDQTMNFMNGDSCAKMLNEIIKSHSLRNIPFFILTAYENFDYNKHCIIKSYTKPLSITNIEEIFSIASKF